MALALGLVLRESPFNNNGCPSFWWFFYKVTTSTPEQIFTQNTPKDVFRRTKCILGHRWLNVLFRSTLMLAKPIILWTDCDSTCFWDWNPLLAWNKKSSSKLCEWEQWINGGKFWIGLTGIRLLCDKEVRTRGGTGFPNDRMWVIMWRCYYSPVSSQARIQSLLSADKYRYTT